MDSNLTQFIQEVKAARSARHWDAMMVLARRGLMAFPGEKTLLKALHHAQAHYVRDKLHSEVLVQLESKGDYLTLLAVYQKLLSVFPESGKLQRLLKRVRKKIELSQHQAREQFFNSADLKIKALSEAGQIEEALQACSEILAVEVDNRRFHKWLKKLEKQRTRSIDSAMKQTFSELLTRMKEDFKLHPDAWLVL